MAQVFHPSSNTVAKLTILGLVFGLPAIGCALLSVNLTYGNAMYVPIEQPVQFSHKHHVGDDGIDCRYCHTSVDKERFANVPPTETCMTCHSQMWSDSPELKPVFDSYRSGKPIQWKRVHDMPDFVYFNHSIHVNKGVSCVTCHGQVDKMALTTRVHTMTMAWCLDCHRHPENYIRPKEKVYDLGWKPSDSINPETKKPFANQSEVGRYFLKEYKILPAQQLTNCSICHH
jgi:hypothetical protein